MQTHEVRELELSISLVSYQTVWQTMLQLCTRMLASISTTFSHFHSESVSTRQTMLRPCTVSLSAQTSTMSELCQHHLLLPGAQLFYKCSARAVLPLVVLQHHACKATWEMSQSARQMKRVPAGDDSLKDAGQDQKALPDLCRTQQIIILLSRTRFPDNV